MPRSTPESAYTSQGSSEAAPSVLSTIVMATALEVPSVSIAKSSSSCTSTRPTEIVLIGAPNLSSA
jgi:hypothetical protein